MTNSKGDYDHSRFELRQLREQREQQREREIEESYAELRQRAAEDLAAEFGTDVSEWLV